MKKDKNVTTIGLRHSRSQGLIDFAYQFAAEAHEGQTRKYTGEPYIVHPLAVAKIVATVTDDCEMWCAALLHDTIEDTPVTFEDIRDAGFGIRIANLVLDLTDVSKPEDGNRALRKKIDRDHIALASTSAQTVKLADLIDNSRSILEHDPGFAYVYMKEKEELLKVITRGNNKLYLEAEDCIRAYKRRRKR